MFDNDVRVRCVLNDRIEHHARARELLDRDEVCRKISDDTLTFGRALGSFLTDSLQRCDLSIIAQFLSLRVAICHQSFFNLRLKTCFIEAFHLIHQSRR